MRIVRLVVWAAGAALAMKLLVGAIRGEWLSPAKAFFVYPASLAAITLGVLVWRRRPESRTGILLTAFPIASLLTDLDVIFPNSTTAVTVGYAGTLLPAPVLVHLVLSYPTGRLRGSIDRGFVALAYLFSVVYALPLLLFYSPQTPWRPDVWQCLNCALPLTHVAWRDVTEMRKVLDAVLLILTVLFLALLVRKVVRATPRGRSIVLPLAAAAFLVTVQFIVQFALFGSPVNSWTHSGWFWIVSSVALLIPTALAGGLLWGRAARAAVADLVVELERTPPGSVRDVLARTLRDPSLELALWLPEQGSYVDPEGRPFDVPAPTSNRAVTVLGPGAAPVAALVHDPALLERPALLEAAGAAARLALENERLQAELRAQLAELRASRARIVHAGDQERRRLERNLHDAPSSGCSGSASRSSSRAGSSAPGPTAQPNCSRRPRASSGARSTSCASSRAASIRRSSPTRASAPPSDPLPSDRRCPSRCSPFRRSGSPSPSRPPPTSSSRSRSRTSRSTHTPPPSASASHTEAEPSSSTSRTTAWAARSPQMVRG